jgi:hypothetical protein
LHPGVRLAVTGAQLAMIACQMNAQCGKAASEAASALSSSLGGMLSEDAQTEEEVSEQLGTDGADSAAGGKKGSSGGERAGKAFTPKGKAEIDAENAAQNGGVNVCEKCKQEVVPGQKSESDVTPPENERQRDHIIPKSKGGDGDPSNGQILCRRCNLLKRDK